MQLSDEELVAQWRTTSDREAIDRLVSRHTRRVRHTVLHMVVDRSVTDDLTQEVFLRACKGLATFRRDSKFATWLYRITVNVCYDFLKTQSGHKPAGQIVAAGDQTDATAVEPADVVMTNELNQQITTAVSGLKPNLRAAIVLTVFQGLSAPDAAGVERCSTDTMYWRIHEARKQLAADLADYLNQ